VIGRAAAALTAAAQIPIPNCYRVFNPYPYGNRGS
jgi:hypothetical protein